MCNRLLLMGLLALLSLGAPGCGDWLDLGDFDLSCSVYGDQHHIRFVYDTPSNLFFGCKAPTKDAMAEGGAQILIYYYRSREKDLRAASVSSSNPDVARFELRDKTVLATAGKAGTARLTLEDGRGSPMDSVEITVLPVTGLKTVLGDNRTTREAAAQVGLPTLLHVWPQNGGSDLIGRGAVHFELSGALARADSPPELYEGDVVGFTASPGRGEIRATAGPTLELALPVLGVAGAEITQMDLLSDEVSLKAGETTWVMLFARAGEAQVLTPRCTSWQVDRAGLTLPTIYPGKLAIDGDDHTTYQISGTPGTYRATCAMDGGPSDTLTVMITPS